MDALITASLASSGMASISSGPSPDGSETVDVPGIASIDDPLDVSGAAGLYITTVPSGAEVYLGSERVGNTNPAFQKTDLIAGKMTRIKLKKQDYHDKVIEVKLKSGINKFESVKLSPAYGMLHINSTPPGARVIIKGTVVGETPYSSGRMVAGQYLVSVEKDLYRPVSKQIIEISDGQTIERNYTLDEDFGLLSIDSHPQGAKILVSAISQNYQHVLCINHGNLFLLQLS